MCFFYFNHNQSPVENLTIFLYLSIEMHNIHFSNLILMMCKRSTTYCLIFVTLLKDFTHHFDKND